MVETPLLRPRLFHAKSSVDFILGPRNIGMMQLDDTVIVITGASRGLGLEMARGFVAHGATVVCCGRSKQQLERVVSELNNLGSASCVVADVRSWNDAQHLVSKAVDQHGQVDILVNNAGVSERSLTKQSELSVTDIPVGIWETIIDTNLKGLFYCTKAVLPAMFEAGSGRLIHISSGMGQSGRKGRSAYVASKFGLEGFHESLTAELAETGVDSLILDPGGGVDTEGFSGNMSKAERKSRLDPSVVVRPAIELAAGEGNHGGRYVATEWK